MLFPLVTAEAKRLVERTPHEAYWKIGSGGGRKRCAILLVKELALFPLKVPFYICFNLALLVRKIGWLALQVLASLMPSRRKDAKRKKYALMVADYFFLLFVVPALRVARIGKLLLASTVYPALCYKKIEEITGPESSIHSASIPEVI